MVLTVPRLGRYTSGCMSSSWCPYEHGLTVSFPNRFIQQHELGYASVTSSTKVLGYKWGHPYRAAL